MTDYKASRFAEARIIPTDPALCVADHANRRDLSHATDHIIGLKTSILEVGQLVPTIVLATAATDKMSTVP